MNRYKPQFEETRNYLSISNKPQNDMPYELIISKLMEVDKDNKKLLSIADNIMKTSFLSPTQPTPTIITEIQNQMRLAFNQLIESLREFYVNIDQKLQHIAKILDLDIEDKDKNLVKTMNLHRSKDKYDILYDRIISLENNLQNTQENQKRLVDIIEGLMKKQQEQPTMNSQREENNPKAKYSADKQTDHLVGLKQKIKEKQPNDQMKMFSLKDDPNQFSHRSIPQQYHYQQYSQQRQEPSYSQQQYSFQPKFQLQAPSQNQPYQQTQNQPYQQSQNQPYQQSQNQPFAQPQLQYKNMIESSVTQNIKIGQYSSQSQYEQEPQCFIKKIYSKPPPPKEVSKKLSIKGLCSTPDYVLDESNKTHRFSYLVENLKKQ